MTTQTQPIIWTLWWQGEEFAPPLVRACIQSMRRYAGGAEVIVLDKDNYTQFIKIPEHITVKFRQGCFSITHLSDILRMQLLYEYGGLWLDSTILVSGNIPFWIFEQDFWSVKKFPQIGKCVAANRWTSFLLAGKKKNLIFGNMNRLFSEYWENHNNMVCYLLIDFFISIIYDTVPAVKQIIDDVPEYPNDIFELAGKLSWSGNMDEIRQGFHKISWKETFDLKAGGKETIFAALLKEYGQNKGERNHLSATGKLLRKVNSFHRHMKELLNIERQQEYGFPICFWTFLNSCFRTNTGVLASYIAGQYNTHIMRYLKED